MPLKLNVGLCKKVGLPDYGSLGATCHLELELDQSLLQHDLDTLHQHIRDAYTACRQAVQDELSREQPAHYSVPSATATQIPTASKPSTPNENRSSGNGNGHYAASEKQFSYINQLARQIKGLGVQRLGILTQQMFSKTLADLSSFEASALIDQLKDIKSGEINLVSLLGAAA
jgi:hypothetical protein